MNEKKQIELFSDLPVDYRQTLQPGKNCNTTAKSVANCAVT